MHPEGSVSKTEGGLGCGWERHAASAASSPTSASLAARERFVRRSVAHLGPVAAGVLVLAVREAAAAAAVREERGVRPLVAAFVVGVAVARAAAEPLALALLLVGQHERAVRVGVDEAVELVVFLVLEADRLRVERLARHLEVVARVVVVSLRVVVVVVGRDVVDVVVVARVVVVAVVRVARRVVTWGRLVHIVANSARASLPEFCSPLLSTMP